MKTDKTKFPGTFRYISLGDIHLGHRGTPTTHILLNLDKVITDEVLKGIDMVIITGDLFDRQLNYGDEAVHHVNRWITLFMMRCAAYNVMIRIVEGTPSHDREQSQFFVEQKINAKIPVDLHYSKTLSIEYIEKLDSHFLYVPDKWHPSTAVTLTQVKEQMAALGIEQVDFAIMHGAFSYQLPSIVEEPSHDEDEYLKIVKHQILIGHVHNMTIHEKIYAAGSFDRICHGDEIDKGLFYFVVKDNGDYEAKFKVNKNAKKYVTLEVHGFDTKQLLQKVKDTLAELPKHSAIRLRCDPMDVANGDIETFRYEYPNYEWSVLVEKATKKKNSVAASLKEFDMSKFIAITPETITGLLREEIEKITTDPTIQNRCTERLAQFVRT